MKTMALRHIVSAVVIAVSTFAVSAREPYTEHADSLSKRSIISKIIGYFEQTNKPKSNKRFDVSFIGGPHFSSDTKLGIGLMAAGTYRHDRNDTLSLPSNVSLYGDVSTVGFYLIGLKGSHLFPHDRLRLNYDAYFYSFPTNFWGIGYETAKYATNKTSFKQFYFKGAVTALARIADTDLFIGPGVEFNRIVAKKVERPELWNGQSLSTSTFGVGAELEYDTRDSQTGPESGWLIVLEQKFMPGWLGNNYAFGATKVRVSNYHKVWRGGVLASIINGRMTYGDVPWGMLTTFGGSSVMRGYYEGRYRDKCGLEAVVELRQHVWRRSGVALWGGAATVVPKLSAMSWRKVLPCFGVGYRWEFKQRTNVRLDFGIGRGETAFIFNINESF